MMTSSRPCREARSTNEVHVINEIFADSARAREGFVELVVTCSPFPDPPVMRVFEPNKGKEILDEFSAQEATFAGADHRASA